MSLSSECCLKIELFLIISLPLCVIIISLAALVFGLSSHFPQAGMFRHVYMWPEACGNTGL